MIRLRAFFFVAVVFIAACGSTRTPGMTPAGVVVAPYVVQSGSPPQHWIEHNLPPAGSGASSIAKGSDGKMWVAQPYSDIISVAMDGSLVTYPIPASTPFPTDITAGSDGNLWFRTCNGGAIWRVTTSGDFTSFAGPFDDCNEADSMVSGLGGYLWAVGSNGHSAIVARINTSGTFKLFTLPAQFQEPWGIAVGSDHNLWFTDNITKMIGRMTPKGVTTSFGPTTYQPRDIALGSDGNIWFVEATGSLADLPATIGKISPAGAITEYAFASNANPLAIVKGAGSDLVITDYYGILWFVNTNGTWTQHTMPPAISNVSAGIAVGPDINYWFVAQGVGVFVRLLMNVTPASISFSQIGQTQSLKVSERGYNGSWTAASQDPSVASVSPSGPATLFAVTALGSGSTVVQISDTKNNTFSVPVSVP